MNDRRSIMAKAKLLVRFLDVSLVMFGWLELEL